MEYLNLLGSSLVPGLGPGDKTNWSVIVKGGIDRYCNVEALQELTLQGTGLASNLLSPHTDCCRVTTTNTFSLDNTHTHCVNAINVKQLHGH